jgi:hypothetical protein
MELNIGTTHTAPDGTTRITFEVVIPASYAPGQCHKAEADLQKALQRVTTAAMTEVLTRFDTHGEPLRHDGREYTSKGKSPQTYHCTGGDITIERHVYQSSSGGATWCPMEERARILLNTTPHFAAIVSGTYAQHSGRGTVTALQRLLQRSVNLEYVQILAQSAGKAAHAQERARMYDLQTKPEDVHSVLVAADATCVAISGEDYKQATAGCFCLLDEQGQRLETIYLAHSPEDAKLSFWERMEREAGRLRSVLGPETPWFGISDGAPDIQAKLESLCDIVTLDFWHLSEYVQEVKEAYGTTAGEQASWVARVLHDLKHNEGAALRLLRSLQRKAGRSARGAGARPGDGPAGEEPAAQQATSQASALVRAAGYVERNLERMEYALVAEEGQPIGSGIIEAACKTVIKQRCAISGARWKRGSLQSVLALRSLYLSSNRWEQFWERCATFGY